MGAITKAVKALPFPGWGGGSGGWGSAYPTATGMRFPIYRGLPGERDWSQIVGDGSGNSIVQACVLWICRNFPQAPMVVLQEDELGVQTKIRGHALPKLWKRPNPFYSGTILWYGVLASYIISGNGYVIKRRNVSGRPAELWYVPHFMMTPRWFRQDSYIDYYEMTVNGVRYPVPVEDVYHLRYGIDPQNIRLGLSPLMTLLKELGVDQEASAFTATILHNLGVPGVVITPDKDQRQDLDEPKREAIKSLFKQKFGGENRGDPIVLSRAANVIQFGFSPDELDLGGIRDIPEERVTAVLGLPASVVGFQQQNSKVGATRAEERDQAFENCIVPTHGLAADELTTQALPEFATSEDDLEFQEVAFDLSKLRVFQDAQGKLAERQATLAKAGIAMRAEARAAVGLPVGPEDKIYIPASNIIELTPDGELVNPALSPGGLPGQKPSGFGLPRSLGTGKEMEDLQKKSEDRESKRDAVMLEGIAALGNALVEAVKSTKEKAPLAAGFEVVRDDQGRLKGVIRTEPQGNEVSN